MKGIQKQMNPTNNWDRFNQSLNGIGKLFVDIYGQIKRGGNSGNAGNPVNPAIVIPPSDGMDKFQMVTLGLAGLALVGALVIIFVKK